MSPDQVIATNTLPTSIHRQKCLGTKPLSGTSTRMCHGECVVSEQLIFLKRRQVQMSLSAQDTFELILGLNMQSGV